MLLNLTNVPACVISKVTRPWAGHLRQFLGPIQPYTGGTGALSQGIKWLGLEAQQSLPCSSKLKNVWSCTSILTCAHMACIETNLCVLLPQWTNSMQQSPWENMILTKSRKSLPFLEPKSFLPGSKVPTSVAR